MQSFINLLSQQLGTTNSQPGQSISFVVRVPSMTIGGGGTPSSPALLLGGGETSSIPSSSTPHTNNTNNNQSSSPSFPTNIQVFFLQSPASNAFNNGDAITQEQFESLLGELFAGAQASGAADKATSKTTLNSLPKFILVKEGHEDLSNIKFSIRELKNRLEILGIDCSSFIEKAELIKALEDNISVCPMNTDDSMCTVCADEMQPGDLITKLPCGHIFHHGHTPCDSNIESSNKKKKCDEDCCAGVMKWLQSHNTCPNCKLELPKEVDNNHKSMPTDMQTSQVQQLNCGGG